MTNEQFKDAEQLKRKIDRATKELQLWKNEITRREHLAYKQTWNRGHATGLETNMSEVIFSGFRESVIADLESQIARMESEFLSI